MLKVKVIECDYYLNGDGGEMEKKVNAFIESDEVYSVSEIKMNFVKVKEYEKNNYTESKFKSVMVCTIVYQSNE